MNRRKLFLAALLAPFVAAARAVAKPKPDDVNAALFRALGDENPEVRLKRIEVRSHAMVLRSYARIAANRALEAEEKSRELGPMLELPDGALVLNPWVQIAIDQRVEEDRLLRQARELEASI